MPLKHECIYDRNHPFSRSWNITDSIMMDYYNNNNKDFNDNNKLSPDWNSFYNTTKSLSHSTISAQSTLMPNNKELMAQLSNNTKCDFKNQFTQNINNETAYKNNSQKNLLLPNFKILSPNVPKMVLSPSNNILNSETLVETNDSKKKSHSQISRSLIKAFEMRSKSDNSPYNMPQTKKQLIRQETINILRLPETEVSRQCQQLWHKCSHYTSLSTNDLEYD